MSPILTISLLVIGLVFLVKFADILFKVAIGVFAILLCIAVLRRVEPQAYGSLPDTQTIVSQFISSFTSAYNAARKNHH